MLEVKNQFETPNTHTHTHIENIEKTHQTISLV